MDTPSDALTLQFLTWITEAPRRYGATMEAWRTSCPRLSIWEDAIRDELVRLEPEAGRPMRDARVAVTPQGLARMVACGLQVAPAADNEQAKRA